MKMFPTALLFLILLFRASWALACCADVVLINGQIHTLDEKKPLTHAVAIAGNQIVALGTDSQMRTWTGHKTRVIDLKGRTVIPGLVDSHMHAIRAALSFSTEVQWIGAQSLSEALERLRSAALKAQPGEWLIVAGGWTPEQFKEGVKPTQAQIEEVAPQNPVYIQWMYDWALLNHAAYEKLGIAAERDLPSGGHFEMSAGVPTGAVLGAIVPLFDRLPKPNFAQKVEGTKAFFAELNRLGVTGLMDPGGFNMSPSEYQALFKVWRDGDLSVRINFSYFAQKKGQELAEFKELTQLLSQGLGDDMLRFNGIGERVTFNMYNNDQPTQADKDAYFEVALWAAQNGLSLTQHWQNGATVHHLLDVMERVNEIIPIAPLRWSIAHLNDAKIDTFVRMQRLGVGWTMQDAMYLDGDRLLAQKGKAALQSMPLLVSAIQSGVHIGAGTDAHRVADYNPFIALSWMIDGKSAAGVELRSPAERPNREQALRLYTQGSVWFTKDENKRGDLKVGKLADLVVLSDDYFHMEASRIKNFHAMMTWVNGKMIYQDSKW